MGEHDCVWDSSQKITLDPARDSSSSPMRTLQSDGSHLSQDSSLRHIHHPRGTPLSLPPSLSLLSHSCLEDAGAVCAPPLLHLQIWRSFFGLFDSMIATCDTSLLPLLLYPGVPIERSVTQLYRSLPDHCIERSDGLDSEATKGSKLE
jgi:hypothetical protein